MDFYLCPIASGSSGNCTYLHADNERLLIDVGVSGKRVTEGLNELNIDPQTIKGILITHEHSDHIKGVGIISRKYDLPIYATEITWERMRSENMLGKVAEHNQIIMQKDEPLVFGELVVTPYSIYHDAVDPVGYVFEYQNKKMVLATDMGKVDRKVVERFYGADGILLEFNHDINMVEVGSYPYYLKQRILGDQGHLCNELAAKVLAHIYHPNLKWAILGHLSNENNIPDLAYLSAKNALMEKNIEVGKDIEITVAKRHSLTPVHRV